MCCNYTTRENCLEDEILVLVLDVLAILFKASNIERLLRIPNPLSTSALLSLKELWCALACPSVPIKLKESSEDGHAHGRRAQLAEVIFKLSMIQNQHIIYSTDVLKKSLFGCDDSCFEYFMLNHWENSAVLVKMSSKASKDDGDIIFSLADCMESRNIDAVLNLILNGLVSCPPVLSDELNILQLLQDIKVDLGCPIRYGQDVRLIKTVQEINRVTEGRLQREIHFCNDWTGPGNKDGTEIFDALSIQDCKNAYYNGYTISLRGMEFRWKKIAAIAHCLAMIFGQPSAGANLYLTPPQSQGLAHHCDDHCVFVCQLVGRKRWTVFPRQAAVLPRLYEPSSCLQHLDHEHDTCEGQEFMLTEGDILYIPRGCPHEAHTLISDNTAEKDKHNQFSLHLTLGIEVEPPFEWEGFIHVALYCWSCASKEPANHRFRCVKGMTYLMSVNLLHVAIRLVGSANQYFRRACMVGAFSMPPELKYGVADGNQSLHTVLDHRACFSHVISIVNDMCNFCDAFAAVESAVKENSSQSLAWMVWFRNLQLIQGINDEREWSKPMDIFKELVQLDKTRIAEIETEFSKVKSDFCKATVFEDATGKYKVLLEKYMTVRTYYTNGMLSLHNTV